MKVFIAPLWALLALLMCLNTNAQDIIYTISGEIDNQKTPLDSIAVENLTNQTQIGFGDLPERDDYRINLSRNEFWGSTSVTDMLNESGLQIIKNLPGTLVVGYRGQKTLNANISLHNNKGQRLAFKENQVLENGTLVEVEIGNAGIYFLTISSPEETRSFKATGMLAAGNMNIAMQSGAPIPLKSGQAYTLAGTGTEKGDNVKVSVFKTGYVAQPVELTVNGNETLVFPLEVPTPPEVQTLEASNILSNSATLNGNVVSGGNSPISERGFYWSATNENPGEADSILIVEGTTGSFSAELSGLNHATSYYVRAYAANAIGTSYGETKSFTTLAILPTVTTTAITNITQTTATSGGNVTSDGGATITERGVCWNTTGNPTIADSKTSNETGTGTFTSSLTGLAANTTYYVRAYATNSQGAAYGEQISFTTTTAITVPTVTTASISNITQTTATSGGNITSDGGATVTARGVCWNTTGNPTIANSKTTNGTGAGTFTSSITGLTVNTTYYVRAYATNSQGTVYGEETSFTTKDAGLNIAYVDIPAGTFTMGSRTNEPNRDSDEKQFQVTLSAFRMSKYEITNAQYAAFLNAKNIGSDGKYASGAYPTQRLIYASSGSYNWGLNYTGGQWVSVAGYENHPVINVTWYGATEFATYVGGTLPSEAQWEYAARGGTATAFSTGACLSNTQANYDWGSPYNTCTNAVSTRPGKTQAVGSYPANAWGLHDMHGNVWEWCSDWYGTYPTTAQTNPTGATSGSYRVYRGGSWYRSAWICRSAFRYSGSPDINYSDLGFRVVLVP